MWAGGWGVGYPLGGKIYQVVFDGFPYKDNCRPSPRQPPDVQPAHVNSAVPFFWIFVSFWQVKSSSVDCPSQIC